MPHFRFGQTFSCAKLRELRHISKSDSYRQVPPHVAVRIQYLVFIQSRAGCKVPNAPTVSISAKLPLPQTPGNYYHSSQRHRDNRGFAAHGRRRPLGYAIFDDHNISGVGNIGLRSGDTGPCDVGHIVVRNFEEISGFPLADNSRSASALTPNSQAEPPQIVRKDSPVHSIVAEGGDSRSLERREFSTKRPLRRLNSPRRFPPPWDFVKFKIGCENWGQRIICWNPGETTSNSIAFIAKWPSEGTRTIRIISRPPMPIRFRPCCKFFSKSKRGTAESA